MQRVYLLLFFAFSNLMLSAQEDSLLQRISLLQDSLAESNKTTVVYLHLDKTIYHKGENIWFTAYLLKQTAPDTMYHTLFAALVRARDKKPVLQQRFVLTEGLSHGYLFLPDSLTYDDYYIVAYTNAAEWDDHILPFEQKVQLVSLEKPLFRIQEIAIRETQDSLYYQYRIIRGDERLYVYESVSYSILHQDKFVQKGVVKTDISGNCTIAVKRNLFQQPLKIQLYIKDKKQEQEFDFSLRPPRRKVLLKWYPESGRLVNGVGVNMGIEARYEDGSLVVQPLQISLCAGMDTIGHVSFRKGRAVLRMLPQLDQQYRWVTNDSSILLQEVSVWEINANGYVLQVADAMPDSLLQVGVFSQQAGTHYLVLKKQEALLYVAKIYLKQQKGKIQIPVNQFPTALSRILLFDNDGKLVAERAVFLPGSVQITAKLVTDSVAYQKRSLVSTTIQLKDQFGKPVKGYFSMAAVLKSRFDSCYAVDIQEYLLAESFAFSDFSRLETKADIDAFLLIHCWTAYQWPVLDNTVSEKPLFFTGKVLPYNKRKRDAFGITLINKSESTLSELILLDANGYFRIEGRWLYAKPDQQFWLIPAPRQGEADVVSIQKVEDSLFARIAKMLVSGNKPRMMQLPRTDVLISQMTTLPNVVVKSSQNNNQVRGVFRSATCDDYVCMYNILNCTNHRYGSKPVNGQVYTYRGAEVKYFSCKGDDAAHFLQLNGTYYTKEFYQADYTKFNPVEPELFSTIYWNHHIRTDENGQAQIRFYTNDLFGQLYLHIQGISTGGVFSGATQLTVRSGWTINK